MKLSSKLYLLLFFLALGVVAYFAVPLIKDRYFQENENGMISIENEGPVMNPETTYDENGQPDGVAEKIKEIEDKKLADTETLPSIPEGQTTIFKEVTREDCFDGCKKYAAGEPKDYCLQSCGIIPIQENPVEKNDEICSEKTRLERDYCIKDLGIKSGDYRICEKISDRNIRKACVTRITEDLLESSAGTINNE